MRNLAELRSDVETTALIPSDGTRARDIASRLAALERVAIEAKSIFSAFHRLLEAADNAPVHPKTATERQNLVTLSAAILDCGGIGALRAALAALDSE